MLLFQSHAEYQVCWSFSCDGISGSWPFWIISFLDNFMLGMHWKRGNGMCTSQLKFCSVFVLIHLLSQETLNYWKQLPHILKYFRAEEDPNARRPQNFMSGFLEAGSALLTSYRKLTLVIGPQLSASFPFSILYISQWTSIKPKFAVPIRLAMHWSSFLCKQCYACIWVEKSFLAATNLAATISQRSIKSSRPFSNTSRAVVPPMPIINKYVLRCKRCTNRMFGSECS